MCANVNKWRKANELAEVDNYNYIYDVLMNQSYEANLPATTSWLMFAQLWSIYIYLYC